MGESRREASHDTVAVVQVNNNEPLNSGKEGAGGKRAETGGRPCLVRGWI